MNTRKTTHDPDDFDMFYPYDRATGKRAIQENHY